ncbi:RNA-directed DNA polymerase, eukaryota, partial [Tanacetum coccineum]
MQNTSVSDSFRREIRGGREQAQFNVLEGVAKSVTLVPMEDRWVWNLDSSGEFSVASIRRKIDDVRLSNVGLKTRWVKSVPIKVNVLSWKVMVEALPTRLNMSRRGISIPSIMCPVCDEEVESVNHLFFRCKVCYQIGRKVLKWWNMSDQEVNSYAEWSVWMASIRIGSKLKEIFEGVWITTWWYMWWYRNKILFEDNPSKKADIFDRIVVISYQWCKSRPSQPIPKTLNHQTSPRFNSRTHHSAMTNSNTPPPPPALTLVEKLYAVHNINSLVPEKLDLQESNYSTWSYFFKGHCSNFNVLNHIDGSTSTSDPPTDEWITADSIVKSWIFLTLSPTLRKRMISTNPASAKAAWDTIETIFQENKRTRTVALKGELRVIQMGDDTPDAYF